MGVAATRLKDKDWIRNSFFLNDSNSLEDLDKRYRFFTNASMKFTDSSLGGNYCINPVPQFTPSADTRVEVTYDGDIRPQGLYDFRNQGWYYSEAIDDNMQTINLRFGFPQFNSLTTFFAGFYNSEAGRMAKTGRSNGLFYAAGRVLGFVVTIKIFPLVLIGMGIHALLWLGGRQVTKYYYLKPAMPTYWSAVTNIVNQISVNEGLIPRAMTVEDKNAMGLEYAFSQEDLKNFSNLMPDIFRENGSVDVYAIANRAQRRARVRQKAMDNAIAKRGVPIDQIFQEVYRQDVTINDRGTNLIDAQDRYWKSIFGNETTSLALNEEGKEVAVSSATDTLPEYKRLEENGKYTTVDPKSLDKNKGWWSSFCEHMGAELDDGSSFACFRVEATGSVQESFSNNTTESEISQKINGMSSESRSKSFSFAGGNVLGGAVGSIVGAVTEAAGSLVSGALDQLNLSGLMVLAGGAFVDIPKHWESSTANLPRASYTIKLISPYNNPISRLININIPLAMILAGVLPKSTGPQSYTSPFLVEYYDRGRCQSRLGIIDSVSINRGITNLGFTNEGKALGIEVTFSIADLSTVMHMPISGGATLNLSKAFFADDNVFSDYLAVLAGMNLTDQIYSSNKLKLRLTQQMTSWRSMFSTAKVAGIAANTLPGRIASAFWKGIER